MLPLNEPPIVESLTLSHRLRASAIYFVTFAGYSAIGPYIALYYSSLGFSGLEIGILLGVGPLLSLIATPFWTGVADSRNKHRLVLMAGIAAIVIINAVFPFLQKFVWILGAVFLLAALSSQVFSLQDSATVHMLGKQRDRYGRIRLWGTVGWGLGAPLFGIVFGKFGLMWMFWIYASMMLIDFFLVQDLRFEENTEQSNYVLGLKRLLGDPSWLLFLLTVFLSAVGMSAHNNFLSLLLQDMGEMHSVLGLVVSVSTAVGIMLAVSTIFELPVMFFSAQLLRRLGNRGVLYLAMGMIGMRNLYYAFVTDASQVLLIQVVHGLTFAVVWLAGVNYAAAHAPRGLNATAQGLFSTVLLSVGFAAGNLLSGT
ncbi:MAG: MFS transporter, partial [Chloroflexi bacterium]|nr:MFS transporter [Chloroflexota bacterium]